MSSITYPKAEMEGDVQLEQSDLPQKASDTVQSVPISAFADLSTGQALRKFWRLTLCGVAASVGGMYLGFTLAIPGSIVANRGFIEQFGTVRDPVTGALALDATYVAVWGGMTFTAQVVFQALSPFTADRFGVKMNLYLFTFWMTAAIITEIFSKNWIAYLFAKLFSGAACGYIGTGIMTYLTEITLPQTRGAIGSIFSIWWKMGSLFGAVGLDILNTTAPLKFRRAFYSEFVLVGIWALPVILLPETPFWYCRQGRHDEAKRSLRFLIGSVDGYDLEHEYECLKWQVQESRLLQERYSKNAWKAFFKWGNLRRGLIATMPFTMQNFSGGALTNGYTTYFLQLAGLSNAFQGTVILYAVEIVALVSAVWLVEKVGRRPLVLIGTAGCGICMVLIGALDNVKVTKASSSGLIVCCCAWELFYGASLSPIGWIFIAESISGLLFSYTVPLMLSNQDANWGERTGYLFAVTCFIWLVIAYYYLPETKGRSFADLDDLFERKVPLRSFHKTKTTVEQQLADEQPGV